MTRGLRRTLVFVAMVAAGLAVVYLLADPFQRRRGATAAAPSHADDEARLRVKDSSQRELQMVFGDVSFDVLPEDAEEGAPPLYRVHIKSGHPDSSGAFLADSPLITLLDERTGESTGELSADQARFELGRAVGGTATIDLGRMRVGHSQLNGNVRGRFTTADGVESHLACETLILRDEVVEAPGLVTWKRQDLSVSGYDLRWDDKTGRLDFATGARLVLPALDLRPGFDLLGPGGLTLDVPPDAPDPRTASHAELRGRVVGSSTDGRTLEGDLLVLDGPAGTVTLTGDAAVEGELPGGERARLTAQRIVVALDEQGAIAEAEAEGGVRLAAKSSPTWLTSERLRLVGSVATSPERVTWGHEALGGAGTGMRWDVEAGTLALETAAEVSLSAEAEHPLAGLRIATPAGLSWDLGPGTGEMQGPVHGTLPDGSNFDGDRLAFLGEAEGVRLEGHAVARRETPALRSILSASTITLVGEGEDAGAARLDAEGQVVVESGAPGLPPSRLLAERLRARKGQLHCEGPFQWTRDGLTVDGQGLDWNETEGRIELAKDARITLVDAARSLDVRAQAQGGLTWVAPPGAADPLAEGRGEMRGGVIGSSADGSRLEADRALIDGPADTITLLGRARIVMPGARAGEVALGSEQPLRLDSERLVLAALRGVPRVSTDEPVQWELGDSSGTAVGLAWDGAARHLHLQRQVEMQLAAAPGQPALGRWKVTADGSLDWQAPPEAQPAITGHLELQGDIVGRSDQGQTFRTEHLVAEGDEGLITLLGPSSFELLAEAGRMRLVAQRSIVLNAGSAGAGGDGTPTAGAGGQRLVAEGEVRATLIAIEDGEPLEVTGERLTLAGEQRTLIVEGPVSVARGEGEDRMTLTAAQHLLVRVDERNEPAWFEANGDVHLSRGFEARGDSLWWDVAADQARLEGACRMDFAGAVMHFERAEFSPRARTFKILRSTLSADG